MISSLDNFFSPEVVTSSRILCEPKPEVDFTAKSVLVEEEEEEEEVEEPEEPSAMSAPPSDTKIATNYEEAVEEQLETEDVKTVISPLMEVEEQEEPESESEDEPEEQPAAESEAFQPNVDYLAPEEPRNVVAISDDEVDEDLPENQGDGNTNNVKKCRMFLWLGCHWLVSHAVCPESCVNASEYDVMTEEGESECGRPMNGTGNELIIGFQVISNTTDSHRNMRLISWRNKWKQYVF